MKNLPLIILLFITIPMVSALCEDNQIDINTASKEELDKLYGIGLVKAQAIIEARPFNSIDDLIKTNGIGKVTLNKIMEQGSACVEGEPPKIEDAEEKTDEDIIKVPNGVGGLEVSSGETEEGIESPIKNKKLEPILLNPNNTKNIKTEKDVEFDKTNYAFYGFILFCILIVFLFFIRRKKFKNEFR